jgi:hypothetical protein
MRRADYALQRPSFTPIDFAVLNPSRAALFAGTVVVPAPVSAFVRICGASWFKPDAIRRGVEARAFWFSFSYRVRDLRRTFNQRAHAIPVLDSGVQQSHARCIDLLDREFHQSSPIIEFMRTHIA